MFSQPLGVIKGAPVHNSYRMQPADHTSTLRWSAVLLRSGEEYWVVNCNTRTSVHPGLQLDDTVGHGWAIVPEYTEQFRIGPSFF